MVYFILFYLWYLFMIYFDENYYYYYYYYLFFYFIKSLNGINFSSAEVGIPTGKQYSHFIQML